MNRHADLRIDWTTMPTRESVQYPPPLIGVWDARKIRCAVSIALRDERRFVCTSVYGNGIDWLHLAALCSSDDDTFVQCILWSVTLILYFLTNLNCVSRRQKVHMVHETLHMSSSLSLSSATTKQWIRQNDVCSRAKYLIQGRDDLRSRGCINHCRHLILLLGIHLLLLLTFASSQSQWSQDTW